MRGTKMILVSVLYLLLIFPALVGASAHKSMEVLRLEDKLVLVSTLSGWLRAVEPWTGELKWSLKEEPVVRVPVDVRAGFTFLPDPQDGSLYLLREGRLKKLPLTIPQLVAASPCKSSDGVLYAGTKKDVWLGLDIGTGKKVQTLNQDTSDRVCPAQSGNGHTVFIGRTEYTLSMFEAASHQRRWNGTFMDYSSHVLPEDTRYDLLHYASSSDGRVLTVDGETGEVLWERDLGLGSPVVALYVLENDGLHRLQFTFIGNETLSSLISNSGSGSGDNAPYKSRLLDVVTDSKKLHQALYVGETEHGLYAVPSLVDEETVTILPRYLGPALLEGPAPLAPNPGDPGNPVHPSRPHVQPDLIRAQAHRQTADGEVLLLGYHDTPETARTGILPITPRPSHSLNHWREFPRLISAGPSPYQPDPKPTKGGKKLTIVDEGSGKVYRLEEVVEEGWTISAPVVLASLATTAAVILAFLLLHARQQAGSSMSGGRTSGSNSGNSRRLANWWSRESESVPEGWVPIGRIQFEPARILGRGCEGTIVYRGRFDNRDVAVKRVVADAIHLADREVHLLRESDTHPHVIRYFCMEADSQFRYIALELCWGTLSDWVSKEELRRRCRLRPPALLAQATNGLAHLHSLKIVHRDIKPQNVLFTGGVGAEESECAARVVISDFGLCKKLERGRNSMSRRSGVTGTDGWIAPEVLATQSDVSVTTAVDIFSMGCVFYYVVSLGQHPFGDSLRRQANILYNEFSLAQLEEDQDQTPIQLIRAMLSPSPVDRPSAHAVLAHPFFWDAPKILAFFQEVSDRVEKEEAGSEVLRSLETGARAVVQNDWRQRICPALQADLRKFRTYRGSSVRDLLRAMRNKKHHYRELPPEVQTALGSIPSGLVSYFTGRFPRLLPHSYSALRPHVASESPFRPYYHLSDPSPPPTPPPSPRNRRPETKDNETSFGTQLDLRPGNVFPNPPAL